MKRPGVVQQPHDTPQSYLINSQGGMLRCNHALLIAEPRRWHPPATYSEVIISISLASVSSSSGMKTHSNNIVEALPTLETVKPSSSTHSHYGLEYKRVEGMDV